MPTFPQLICSNIEDFFTISHIWSKITQICASFKEKYAKISGGFYLDCLNSFVCKQLFANCLCWHFCKPVAKHSLNFHRPSVTLMSCMRIKGRPGLTNECF